MGKFFPWETWGLYLEWKFEMETKKPYRCVIYCKNVQSALDFFSYLEIKNVFLVNVSISMRDMNLYFYK